MKEKFDYRKYPYAFMTPDEMKKQKEREKYEKEAEELAKELNKKMETDEHSAESVMMRDAFYEYSQEEMKKYLIKELNKPLEDIENEQIKEIKKKILEDLNKD